MGRRRLDPVWRKAPWLLLRFPGLLLAIVVAATVLALATASNPLFLSSAGNAALAEALEGFTDETVGVSASLYGPLDPARFAEADTAVTEAAGRVDAAGGERILEIEGFIPRLAAEGVDEQPRVQVLARTGALAHIQVVEQARGDQAGFWIADSVAETLRVGAGDTVTARYGDARERVPIVGVYRDLTDLISVNGWRAPDSLPADSPIVEYWQPQGSALVVLGANGPEPQPPPLLAEPDYLPTWGDAFPDTSGARYTWTFPFAVQNRTLPEAQRVATRMRAFERQVSDPLTDAGAALAGLNLYSTPIDVQTLLPSVISEVRETVLSLTGSVQPLSMAAQVVALAVLGAAGVFAVQRRRAEMRLLTIQGVSPGLIGLRVACEALVAAAVGAVAGWGLAIVLVRLAGPSDVLAAGVQAQALQAVAVITVVGVVLLGVVTAELTRRRSAEHASRARQLAARAPWELVALVLAAAAYYELATRGTVARADGEPAVDVFLLAFPVLFIAGFAGLASRGLTRLLPRLRGVGGRRSAVIYLVTRRLAGAPILALLLVTASTVAIGLLTYAATVAHSTSMTVEAKAAIATGSDVAAQLPSGVILPEGFAFPATLVARAEGRVEPGDERVDILAIDTATFADAAFWDARFADQSLASLLAGLTARGEGGRAATAGGRGSEPSERVPVLYTGPLADRDVTLTSGTNRYTLPIRVTGRPSAFPGMAANDPLVVVDARRFLLAVEQVGTSSIDERILLRRGEEVWVRGDTQQVVDALSGLGVGQAVEGHSGTPTAGEIRTAAHVRRLPALAALQWTFAYLRAVGVAAAALVLVAMVLYLQSRQQAREVSYALARRMGLTRSAHVLVVAAELGGMLAAAAVTGGVLAALAAWLVLGQVDPLPDVPPAPLFTLPVGLLAAVAAAVLAACLVGAWLVQRIADRARVAEVLRLAA